MLPGVLLSMVMLWSVMQSITIARWAEGLEILVPVALPALLVGVIFARLSRLPVWLAHLLSAALGITWTIHQLDPLLDERLTTWRDQATEFLIRIIIWVRILANGGRGEDIVLFVTALALLGWILGYTTAWYLFRHGWTWWAILLNAMFILVNYVYAFPKPTTLFFVFLAGALLLIAYQNIAARQERWAAMQIEYPEYLPIRLMIATAVFCGTIIFGTSLLPSNVSYEQAQHTWEVMKRPFVIARERWEDAFSTINSPPGTSGSSFTIRNSSLGGARLLGNEVVMYVRAPRFEYWRAVAFDRYTSEGWQNTTAEHARSLLGLNTPEQARTVLDPGLPMPQNDLLARTVMTQTVELAADRKDDFVTVGGQALQVSLPTLVEHDYVVVQNRLVPNFDDTALIISREPLRASRVYSVTALVSVADVQSLRQAGMDYPEWVRDRYLQIPNTVTPRTLAQAREIVQQAGATNAYDQAIALQDYLRTIPYNESIPAPPPGVDPVDYFLFEQREGYCDYYASAMVVMLRYLGVPARWVQGYAGGQFDPERGAYVVRENVAHSWPEVYFPGYGWQRFEPTPASYTTLPQRPETPPDSGAGLDSLNDNALIPPPLEPDPIEQNDTVIIPEEQPAEALSATLPRWWERFGDQFAIAGIVIAITLLAGTIVVVRWRREVGGLSPAATVYAQLGILARWAGLGQRSHVTPYEYADELGQALPEQRAAIRQIVNAYVHEQYRRAYATHTQVLAQALRQVRRPLIRRIFVRFDRGRNR